MPVNLERIAAHDFAPKPAGEGNSQVSFSRSRGAENNNTGIYLCHAFIQVRNNGERRQEAAASGPGQQFPMFAISAASSSTFFD